MQKMVSAAEGATALQQVQTAVLVGRQLVGCPALGLRLQCGEEVPHNVWDACVATALLSDETGAVLCPSVAALVLQTHPLLHLC